MGKNNSLPISREGIPFIAGGIALAIACLTLPGWAGALFFFLYTLFALWFFRDPERVTPPGDDLVICPADGRVVEVMRVEKAPYIDEPALKIGIFMSPFNVHVNRAPASGVVERIEYRRGVYVNASYERASLVNEHNAAILRLNTGQRLMFVQVAGFVARRIVCYLAIGDRVEAGQRVGLIRFGSRVDVYMPPNSEISVKSGEAVTAGETPLGRISK